VLGSHLLSYRSSEAGHVPVTAACGAPQVGFTKALNNYTFTNCAVHKIEKLQVFVTI
jgi:hypothetical protein